MADTETVTPPQVPVPTTPEEFAIMPIRKNTRISAEKKLSEAIPKVPTLTQPSMQTSAVRNIETITTEILDYKKRAEESIIEIGKCLIEAKKNLNHGEWLPWLHNKVDFSEVTAQRFMRIAKEFSNPSSVTDLGFTKAFTLLTLEEDERKQFIAEVHEINGAEKSVYDMTKRELEQVIAKYNKNWEKEPDSRKKFNDIERTFQKYLSSTAAHIGKMIFDFKKLQNENPDMYMRLSKLFDEFYFNVTDLLSLRDESGDNEGESVEPPLSQSTSLTIIPCDM